MAPGGDAAVAAPLVDIGIPVYRRTDWVAQAIESIVAQSYRDWRLTIGEDGEPTGPIERAVAPYLADERIGFSADGEHLGVARTKSRLCAGEGKYLTILDDDDYWLPGWLERRVAFLEQHPSCGMVWGGHLDVTPEREAIRRSPLPFAEGVVSSAQFVRAMMQGNFVATSSVLVRRETYASAGDRYDATFRHIDDYELWLRLGMHAPVGFLAVHDSAYRLHDVGRMSRKHDRAPDHLQMVDHLDALLARHLPELRLSPATRRRQKAEATVSTALDAAGEGEATLAARRLLAAVRLDPRALATRRAAAVLAAALGGSRVRERLSTMRP